MGILDILLTTIEKIEEVMTDILDRIDHVAQTRETFGGSLVDAFV